ncbi:MAG TPA: efflux RND transporter periplasmic adaptor subunit [Tepidisphaeraceae bacterium]|jgi:RND family efflux transporter MFP subunit
MKRIGYVLLLIAAIVIAGAGGYWYGHHPAENSESEAESATTEPAEPTAVAQVITTPLVRKAITETLTAYGTVVPKSTDQQTVSAQIEAQVVRLLVSAGQLVQPGQPVVQVNSSPDTSLQFSQAKNAANAAAHDLAGAQQRFKLKLATTQELQTAENAAQDAELKLDDLKRRGAGEPQTLKSPAAGVVAKVDVTLGQIVPAGMPLMEIDNEANVEVRLGVDPSEAGRFKINQPVDLFSNSANSGPIHGQIRLITRRVSPETRLVDVFVSLPRRSRLLIDSYVRAHINVATDIGLIALRSAVLPEANGSSLFTVENGHAVKHLVSVGLQTDKEVEVIDPTHSLKPGEPMVTVGNYELDDGAPVTMGSAP